MAKTTKPDTLGIAELAANLAEAQDLSKARAKSILDGVRDHIVETLLTGNRVNLFGLGTFEVRACENQCLGIGPKMVALQMDLEPLAQPARLHRQALARSVA